MHAQLGIDLLEKRLDLGRAPARDWRRPRHRSRSDGPRRPRSRCEMSTRPSPAPVATAAWACRAGKQRCIPRRPPRPASTSDRATAPASFHSPADHSPALPRAAARHRPPPPAAPPLRLPPVPPRPRPYRPPAAALPRSNPSFRLRLPVRCSPRDDTGSGGVYFLWSEPMRYSRDGSSPRNVAR